MKNIHGKFVQSRVFFSNDAPQRKLYTFPVQETLKMVPLLLKNGIHVFQYSHKHDSLMVNVH